MTALVLTIAGLAAVAACGVRSEPGAPASTPTACVYTSHSISALNAFSRLVNRQMSCVLVFNDAAPDWDALVDPWFTVGNATDHRWDRWVSARKGRQLVIAQSLIPSDAPADWRRRGAAGEYDDRFRRLGRHLVAAGLGRSIIRLAHEANGDWFRHNVGGTSADRRDWARYWARVARILHRTPGGRFRLDLTISAGAPYVPLSQWYPGDRAVDIIGVDQHDLAPPEVTVTQPSRWRFHMTQRGGIRALFAFARSRGKPVSVPEWGLTDRAGHGAGDDAYYVRRMMTFFRTNHVVYAGFWNKSGSPGELSRNPRSLRVYRSRS